MQTLLAFFGGILSGLRALVGLVLPVFAEAADFRNWPGWLKVLVGLLLTAGLAYLAFHVQKWTGLDGWLGDVDRDFKPYFLASLVLLVVLFSWLLYGLWTMLARDEGAAEFPDIEAAWAQATRRLAAAGLGPADAPLYLVLGRPAAGIDALFLAAGVKEIIRTPSTGQPPLRVYAWDEAIYVTCDGASAWGTFCTRLTGEDENAWAGTAAEPDPAARGTIGPGAVFEGLDPVLRSEMDALLRASKERDLQPDEHDRLRFLAEQATVAHAPGRRKLAMPETQQAEAVRRLQFLCRLIRRDRRPWCPVNGLVVLVPWSATETDDAVRAGSGVLQRDLNAARSALQLRYPTYAVVCDLETARGFAEFRSGFPSDVLRQRIGQRLPLGPDVDAPSVPGVVAAAVQWIGLAVLPAWIHRFLQLDRPDPRTAPTGASQHNRNLYLLMRAVFERGPRLAQLLSRGLPPVHGPVGDPAAGLPLFAGCYLAGTGRTPEGQAFVPGIFQRVTDGQNLVSWAPEAADEDARFHRLMMLGYVAIVLLLAATVAGLWWWVRG
jgi:hypothetical protein